MTDSDDTGANAHAELVGHEHRKGPTMDTAIKRLRASKTRPNFPLSKLQSIDLAIVCRKRGVGYWVRSGLMARSSKARLWIGVGLVWRVRTYFSLRAVVAWILQ